MPRKSPFRSPLSCSGTSARYRTPTRTRSAPYRSLTWRTARALRSPDDQRYPDQNGNHRSALDRGVQQPGGCRPGRGNALHRCAAVHKQRGNDPDGDHAGDEYLDRVLHYDPFPISDSTSCAGLLYLGFTPPISTVIMTMAARPTAASVSSFSSPANPSAEPRGAMPPRQLRPAPCRNSLPRVIAPAVRMIPVDAAIRTS